MLAAGVLSPVNLSCGGGGHWKVGDDILANIRGASFVGESGTVRVDSRGARTDVGLGIWRLEEGDWAWAGAWAPGTGLAMSSSEGGRVGEAGDDRTLVVSTVLSAPYTMVRLDGGGTEARRYEGFAVDLITEVANIAKFNFTVGWAGRDYSVRIVGLALKD